MYEHFTEQAKARLKWHPDLPFSVEKCISFKIKKNNSNKRVGQIS